MADLLESRSLEERLKRRLAVEKHFARTGHTFRHGPLHRAWENFILRPALKGGLKTLGLYERGVQNALSPVVRNLRFFFPDLPPDFDGFQILHISDLHIDGVDGLTEALSPVLKSCPADLCVITGDYRFEDRGPADEVYPRMQTVLSSIRARCGTFGILGNHDSGEIGLTLEEMGLPILLNEAVEIRRGHQSIWLAGVDDPFDYRCHDIQAALSAVPAQAFKVLLAHAPEIFDEAAESGVSLYLSGHTHGGQIRFPAIGAIRHNAHCPPAYAYGHWQHGDMQGFTTAGLGCSALPIRFNCPPEVVRIELRCGVQPRWS
jgi:predicted MPP superfamily phosphohydrolase